MKHEQSIVRTFLFVLLIYPLTMHSFQKTTSNKDFAYEQLLALENKRKMLKSFYEQQINDELDQIERDRLEKEYLRRDFIISENIEKQKLIIQTLVQQKLLWNVAKFFGGAAVIGYLTYNFFAAPKIPEIEGENPLAVQQFETDPIFSIENEEIVPEKGIPSDLRKISTPEERALYQLRYKNYSAYAAGTFFPTTGSLLFFGPVALPIDLILFALSVFATERAWYYKNKLNMAD